MREIEIPDEAVERAARALFDASVARGEGTASHQWDDAGLGAVRVSCRADATAVLAAAAPLILAAELDPLAAELREDGYLSASHDVRQRVAYLRATPAAVTPEPAGPRVWVHGSEGNPDWISPYEAHLTGVGLRNRHGRTWHWRNGGWRLDGRQDAKKRFDGYDPTTRYAFWALVEQRGPLTEVPAVPSAEPGAGA